VTSTATDSVSVLQQSRQLGKPLQQQQQQQHDNHYYNYKCSYNDNHSQLGLNKSLAEGQEVKIF